MKYLNVRGVLGQIANVEILLETPQIVYPVLSNP